MIRIQPLLLSVAISLACAASVEAQSYQPKSFQFKGDSEYSNAELTAAAGLRKGMSLTTAEMNEHTKLLLDSGIFENISYSFNGQDMIFRITPSAALYELHLENLPVANDKALNEKLHARLPLYHGKVPGEGTLLDGVRKALEEELSKNGAAVTIAASPYEDRATGKLSAISLSITSPSVVVGKIEITGVSAAFNSAAQSTAAQLTGSAYSADGSVNQLETKLRLLYQEQGYLEAAVHATASQSALSDAEGFHIPLSATVDEGAQYKLSGVQLAPDLAVTQAAFDKQSGLHAGDIVSPEKLRAQWAFLARQYHNQGLMKANIVPAATIDHAHAMVSYAVSAQPGPVYTMGSVKVENVTDDLRALILKAWPLPAGSTFNEGAILGLTATHNVNPALERVFAAANLRYAITLHDDVHTVDVVLRLERKH